MEPNESILFVLLTDSFIMFIGKTIETAFLKVNNNSFPAVTGPNRFRKFWETDAWIEIYPVDSAIDLLNNWGLIRGVRVVSRLRKQHMTTARARTQTSRCGVQRTGHQATAPTTQTYYTIVFYSSQGYKNWNTWSKCVVYVSSLQVKFTYIGNRYGPFSRWLHLITTTRIHFVSAFLFKFLHPAEV